MEYRQLGRTGLPVSVFGMGCGNFGSVGSAPEFFGMGESEEEAFPEYAEYRKRIKRFIPFVI